MDLFSKTLLAGAAALALVACGRLNQPAYRNAQLPVEQRLDDLMARLTLEEKAGMVSGGSWMDTRPVKRLGIPALKTSDGPLGVRYWSEDGRGRPSDFGATAFPAGVAMAATWDPEIVQREGKALAQQVRALGRNMLLGPTVNIARIPQWGRNFEGFGEDPYLTSRIGVAYIKGLQDEGVIATVKHFAANNQEFERHRVDVKVSERALQEIYYPAFRAAVEEAHVGSVMSSYNKLNGIWAAENPQLLTEVLKKQFGFTGFVVSDWASTHTTVETANAGLDVEMPSAESCAKFVADPVYARYGFVGGFMPPEKLLPAIRAGKVSEATLNDKVRRILRSMLERGLLDRPEEAPSQLLDTPEQQQVARDAALESLVLLKNAGDILPLGGDKVRSIAVIGPNADVARTGGGGSSLVAPKSQPITPLKAIQARAGAGTRVRFAAGVRIPGEDKTKDTPEARAALLKEAVELAAASDTAVVFAGYSAETESEMFDRELGLPAGQDELIQAVAKANRRTVVVLNAGGPVLMDAWLAQVPAVLMAWYPGQEAGFAPAAILFGDANPSGKLPTTFLKAWRDSPAYGHYPGKDLKVDYAEGIYVGYRHFDKKKIEPLFAFGHGLSYTKFEYSEISLPAVVKPGEAVSVGLKLKNGGPVAGAEVVQIYLRDVESGVDRPVKELKAFQRVMLQPGESRVVKLRLAKDAMSFYDEKQKAWVAEPGAFEVQVGASSRDIRLKGTFQLAGN